MIDSSCKKFIYFLFIYLTSQISFASSTNPYYPKLTMHGESYENSCAPEEKLEWMSNIEKNVARNSRALQTAVNLILCGSDTPQNIKKVLGFVDKVVTTTYEATAEERVVGKATARTAVAKDIMAKGRAWSTTLQFNDDEVTLQYFSSEACVEGVKLRRSKNLWLVYEIGGACD